MAMRDKRHYVNRLALSVFAHVIAKYLTLLRQSKNVMQFFFLAHLFCRPASTGACVCVRVNTYPSRSQMPFDCSLARQFVSNLYEFAENIHEFASKEMKVN